MRKEASEENGSSKINNGYDDAVILLAEGAKAVITKNDGECPIHFLVEYKDNKILKPGVEFTYIPEEQLKDISSQLKCFNYGVGNVIVGTAKLSENDEIAEYGRGVSFTTREGDGTWFNNLRASEVKENVENFGVTDLVKPLEKGLEEDAEKVTEELEQN